MLQLRAMMWFAWLSCHRQLRKIDERQQEQAALRLGSATATADLDKPGAMEVETETGSKQEDADHTMPLTNGHNGTQTHQPV